MDIDRMAMTIKFLKTYKVQLMPGRIQTILLMFSLVSFQGDSRICFGKYGDVAISEYLDEHSTQQSTGHGELSLLNKGGEDIWIENSESSVYVTW